MHLRFGLVELPQPRSGKTPWERGWLFSTFLACLWKYLFFFRCEETLTQNLRSLTGKYQDLEDSYSE